jgi:hypothetical protein
MERAFTEDIKRLSGEVKYREGEVRDFSHDTWNGIARSLKRPLEDFSELTVKETAARVNPLKQRRSRTAPKSPPPAAKVVRRRVVAQEGA